jgi:beta-N-acetylhexosaminidase
VAVGGVLAACDLGRSGSMTPVPTTLAPSPPAPTPVSPTPTTASASASATARPLRERIGQMLLVGFRGLTVDQAATTVTDIRDRNLGGILLFSVDQPTGGLRNIESRDQLRALVAGLQAEANTPLAVAIDQEGGRVARLGPDHGFPQTQSAAALGARDDPAYTERQARQMATTLADVGVTLNLAPVVDLNVNPDSPAIGALDRSFSADPDVVVEQAMAFIRGHRSEAIGTTLKHFPGHGSATGDTHLGVVDVTDTWTDRELQPFARLIQAGLPDAVLTAHVFDRKLDPRYPGSLSPAIVTGLLRKQIGWDGVVISDDLQMGAIRDQFGFDEAVVLAVEAGVDLLTIANQLEFVEDVVEQAVGIIERAVTTGRLTEARIDESLTRIERLKAG